MTQDFTNTFKGLSVTPYNLIAAGGGKIKIVFPDGFETTSDDIKRELGYPQLYAWNAERTALLEWVSYLKENPDCKCRLVVDSGAYSVWSIGKPFDMDEYIDFLNSNDVIETCFWAAEADVIPGSFGVDPTEEERAAAPEKSWQNYLYMIERVKMPKKIVPIFHQGEDFKHLERMLNYKFEDGDHIPYIGISPRNDVSVPEKIAWYKVVWKVIKESANPNVLTHNFGMTTTTVMEQFPSYSSDSTSWVRSAAFGNVLNVIDGNTKATCVSARKLGDPNHILNKNNAAVKELIEETCKKIGHGMCLDTLINGDDNAALKKVYNLYALNDWRVNFKYKGNNQFKKKLW